MAGFALLVISTGLAWADTQQKVTGPRMSDVEFFAALDLDRTDMRDVKRAVHDGDWDAAKHAFVDHLKQRKHPRWFFSWRDKPENPDPSEAPESMIKRCNRYVNNELSSCGVWHDFGDDIDWTYNATKKNKEGWTREWTWQLSRHGYWRELGEAYWLTGNEEYVKTFVRHMRDWIQDNPVPVEEVDQGTGSRWRTIEAGIRLGQCWTEAMYRFLPSPNFTDDDVVMMVKSIAEHARYLVKFPTGGNWLMMESYGLYNCGALFPEYEEAESWRQTAINRLYDELENQVYPDGAQFELTTGYHQATLKNAEWALRVARLNEYPVPQDYLDRMEKLYDYNLYMCRPNWCLPDLNDGTDRNMQDYMEMAYKLMPHRKDYQFAATAGEKGVKPEHTSYPFHYAGFMVMRSGWDRQARWGLMEVGPFGAGHQHEDKLQLIIHAYDKYLLIDPGNYLYDTSKWRKYVYRSYAHNVMHIDGMEQYRRGQDWNRYVVKEEPLPHEWQSNDKFDYSAASYGKRKEERYGPEHKLPAVWTRQVLFVKDSDAAAEPREYWLVVDELNPTDDEEHLYEAMFHVDASGVDVHDDNSVVSTDQEGANLAIVPADGVQLKVKVIKGQEEPVVQGWTTIGHDEVKAIPTVYFTRKESGPTRFVYVFYPLPEDTQVPVEKVEVTGAANGTTKVDVTFADGQVDQLSVGREVSVQR
jgi:hypothetical protein